MLAQDIIINQTVLSSDGLGGRTEELREIIVRGKIFYKKGVKVVTRAYDTLTRKIPSMYVLYLSTHYNDINLLMSLKKGDKLDSKYGKFEIDDIEAHNTNFIITFIEESVD